MTLPPSSTLATLAESSLDISEHRQGARPGASATVPIIPPRSHQPGTKGQACSPSAKGNSTHPLPTLTQAPGP